MARDISFALFGMFCAFTSVYISPVAAGVAAFVGYVAMQAIIRWWEQSND